MSDTDFNSLIQSEYLKEIIRVLFTKTHELYARSETSKLWLSYKQMVGVDGSSLKQIVQALDRCTFMDCRPVYHICSSWTCKLSENCLTLPPESRQ